MRRGALLAMAGLPAAACAPVPDETSAAVGRIVFASDADGAGSIYVLDVASGVTSRLTARDGYADIPRWSPDGRRIAFTADWAEPDPPDFALRCPADVFVMAEDGTNLRQLTDNDAVDGKPDWSY